MFSHSNKLHALAVKNAIFDLAMAKLEEETWQAMINSGRSFIVPKTNGR